jgi:signal transduction histidine kinase
VSLESGHRPAVPDPSPPARRPAAPDSLSSLRTLALLCVLLPLLAYAAVGFYRYGVIRADTEQRLDRALRVAQEHALKVFETNEAVLARVLDAAGVEETRALRARQPELHAQMRAMTQGKPQIQSAWLLGEDGKAVASDRFQPVPATDFSDRSYFRWHQAGKGGLFLSEMLFGRATRSEFFDMSRGRYRADGSFLGMASVSMTPEYFQKVHSDLVADERGLAITMMREDGVIYSRWPTFEGSPRSLSPASPVMQRIRSGQASGTAHGVSSIDGRERLLTYRKVGGYPVYIGSGMDVGEIRKRWLEEMAWLAAFGIPPLLGLYFAARVALRRTREALRTAERLNDETQARRRVEEALLQAQKLEALGRLTGGVAHDFNNALMVVSNNLVLLKMKHPGVGTAQVESIGRAVGSATRLTRQLLAFSRRQALVPERMVLQDRLPGLAELVTPVLGGRITFSAGAAPDTRPILVDAAEFELALLNLAINARDAMPQGGTFTVRAGNAQGPLPPLLQGHMVVVEVTDTGTGIAPELLDKVFEPFFTTKAVGEGTGLGLSQVYGLCQRAGGLATVQSRLGQGTTVRLYFPAAPEGRDSPSGAQPVPLQRHPGKRVLLVEDNDEVAQALTQVLQELGCEVTRHSRAVAARNWLALQSSLPDLLLTDVVMPGEMDGLGLALHVKSHYPALKVVVMTGYAEQMEALSRLGYEILPKPCSAEMLGQAMARAFAAA